MRVIVTESYEELGKVASQHVLGHVLTKQNRVNLAITAGTTPLEVYRYLVPEVKGKSHFSHVHFTILMKFRINISNVKGLLCQT